MTTDVTPPIVYDCPDEPLKYRMVRAQSNAAQVWREPFGGNHLQPMDHAHQWLPIHHILLHGDPFVVGNTRVTYNFKDSASNLAECIFIISVVGKMILIYK